MPSSDTTRKQDKKASSVPAKAREFIMTMVPDMVLVAEQNNMHTMHQRMLQVKTIYV